MLRKPAFFNIKYFLTPPPPHTHFFFYWKAYQLHVFSPLRSPQLSMAVTVFTYRGWLCASVCVCVCVFERPHLSCVQSIERAKKRLETGKKGAMFSSEPSTCVCHWANTSFYPNWKTACGLLFGIEFQGLSALLISPQKAKRAINTPSHGRFSRGVMDRISNASVYPRYLSLSLAQARCVWSTVWEAGSGHL